MNILPQHVPRAAEKVLPHAHLAKCRANTNKQGNDIQSHITKLILNLEAAGDTLDFHRKPWTPPTTTAGP